MSKQRRRLQATGAVEPQNVKKQRKIGKRDTIVLTNQQEIDELKDAEVLEQIPAENSYEDVAPVETPESDPRRMDLNDLQKGLFMLKNAHDTTAASLEKINQIQAATNDILESHTNTLQKHSVSIEKLDEACRDHEHRIASIELTMRSLKVKDVVPPKAATAPTPMESAPAPALEPAPAPASKPAPTPSKAKLDPVVEKIVKKDTFTGKDGRVAAKGYYAVYPDNSRVGPFVEARLACQASPIGTVRAEVFWLNSDGSFASKLNPKEVAEMFL